VIVHDNEIAAAIREIEQRTACQRHAASTAVGRRSEFRTLIDQVRAQIGWSRVLREVLARRPTSPMPISRNRPTC